MPFEFRLYPDQKVAVATLTGVLDTQVLYQVFHAHETAPGFDAGQDLVMDLSAVEEFDLDFIRLVGFVERLRFGHVLRLPGTRIACVAPDDTGFGTARILEGVADERLVQRVLVCRSWEEALAGLELSADPRLT